MKPPRLHHDATARTLAFARVFIFALWLVRILTSELTQLGYLSDELFHSFGVVKILPQPATTWLTTPLTLLAFKSITLVLIVWVIFGAGRNRVALVAAALMLTLYFGIAKGFGGHVNHRELVLLYLTYLLIPLRCFDAFAIRRGEPTGDTQLPYQTGMQLLCCVIVLNYFFVATARVFVGFPHVFDPDVMYNWVLSRNVRPNPYGLDIGLQLLSSSAGRVLLALALPLSTVVELTAPLALWSGRRVRCLLLVCLAAFHLGIFLIMNIAFFENIAVLLLLWQYTPQLERCVAAGQRVKKRGPSQGVLHASK